MLELRSVSKAFGEKIVLDKLSMKINKGEILGIIGKSGCGKSTLLKIIMGIYPFDSGEILFKGEKPAGMREIIGYTTQENAFYDDLTVEENIKYYANLYGVEVESDNLLESVGLYEARRTNASRISGGMKRRLDFAISIVHDPKILILDEPTTGLDPILVRDFWQIVKKTVAKGRTAIVISHQFDELEDYCDKVAVMDKGRITKIIRMTKRVRLVDYFMKVLK